MEKNKGKIFTVSLGCPKNLVDTEYLLGLLKSAGFEPVEDLAQAEFALVNTCAFIEPAVEETIDTVLELGKLRKYGKLKRLVVAGCFVQRYGYKLQKEIPEVDAWLGPGELSRIQECFDAQEKCFFIGRPKFLPDHRTPRIRTTPFYTAYLKIAEGCSHSCAFCLIPKLRGALRSRTLESLVQEAEVMASEGVIELNVVAQDITSYGKDLKDGTCLETLLANLAQVKGIKWIRLLYTYPAGISDRLLSLLQDMDVICPYLDIPFQHVDQGLLKAMGRYDQGNCRKLIEKIRNLERHITLRTTLMVGFPGETDEMFRRLCDFVRWAEFDHLGVFTYSPEKGTTAYKMKNKIDKNIAESRRQKLMEIQAHISERKNKEKKGQVLPVLIEGYSEETDLLLQGRTSTMAPEVDGTVLINKGTGKIGEIMNVVITETHTYDLIGEIIP